MALDCTQWGDLNTNCPESREKILFLEIEEKLGEHAKTFVVTKFRDAGGKTPLQMARASYAGYKTARCLLNPTPAC